MDGQSGQVGNNTIAGWVGIGTQQFGIVVVDGLWNCQHQLGDKVATGGLHLTVGNTHDVQHHIIIVLIRLMSVDVPVARTVVHLHIAHP